MTTTVAAGPAVRIRGRTYPVLLPTLADPRLHVAAVIVTVQVLGQTVLGFDVSIAQILLAVGTAAVLELGIVASTRGVLAWPASALLTGNGVALLLRTPGTVHGDWWSTTGWPIFVAAAGVSVLSKYAIRVDDRPLFNPSNLGLVVVFLVFGSAHADPQDLWWGPWRPALAATVAIIVIGGITLSVRLKLFSVAAAFWLTFAASAAVLAVGGHAITARWHLGPLEGWDYWWILVLSPEVVIFVFFMITDPKTAPRPRLARPVYAAAVGLGAGLLAAAQRTEYATKVSLLAALTIVCATRPWLERRFPAERRATGRGVAMAAAAILVGLAGVAVVDALSAGPRVALPAAVSADGDGRPSVNLPSGAVPEVAIAPEVLAVPGAVTAEDAQRIGRDLVASLAIEAEARGALDADLAATAAFGRHLAEVDEAIAAAREEGIVVVEQPSWDSLEVVLLQDPVSPQAVPQLGVLASGTVARLTYDGSADGRLLDQAESEETRLYLVTELGGSFLVGQVLEPDSPMLVGG
ncbi:MAG: hypothetical protein KDA98_02805 [Acidimicrobiales bacterium]|nr:hypothetical protein [Acidimicrobiales bacterium]